MTDRTVRMGIIGLGAQGGYYAGFLSRGRVPNVQLAAICDTDGSKREAAEGFGVPFFTDYHDMLASGQVDAEVTTIPHYLHPDLIPALAETGGVVVFHEQVIQIIAIMTRVKPRK